MVREHGVGFTTSLGRTMIFGNMANVVFGLAVFVSTLTLSATLAIPLAYLCATVFGLLAHRILIELLGVSGAPEPR